MSKGRFSLRQERKMTERHPSLVRTTRKRHAQPKGVVSVRCVNGCPRCIRQLAQRCTSAKA
jgi:hypothetical protein